MNFDALNLDPRLLKALAAQGYVEPTPIQQQAIPPVLDGKDLLGCAQTGTGKTAAFALPILQHLLQDSYGDGALKQSIRPIRALILTPTRELAVQIGENIAAYAQHTGLRHAVIFGGVKQGSQVQRLKQGIDILVATPGRLLDLMHQGLVDLRKVDRFVLDEADRMLDMGFIGDIRKIVAIIPKTRQTLFFSATMPTEIQGLANSLLRHPVRIEVSPVASTVDLIDQHLYYVDFAQKQALLNHLLADPAARRVLIFVRTRHGADRVVRHLHRANITADAIHSDKSQNARQSALNRFKSGEGNVLVATDIAARGIDVDDITHVVNFDLPNVPETYVHRIGRTGRAKASGTAISFCDIGERPFLRDIEKTIQKRLTIISEHPFPAQNLQEASVPTAPPTKLRSGGGQSMQARNRRRRPQSNENR